MIRLLIEDVIATAGEAGITTLDELATALIDKGFNSDKIGRWIAQLKRQQCRLVKDISDLSAVPLAECLGELEITPGDPE